MTEISGLFSPLSATSRGGVEGNTNLAEDFNNFLNLLTIQLQNQDPLEPLDTNQFTEQIVQMTGVEQTVSMNERLGALIDAQETQRIHSAVDFVGKHADALGDTVALHDGLAENFYSMQSNASSITAQVVNADNEVVHEFSAPLEAGLHRLTWDGVGDDGDPVDPDGQYRINIVPRSADGSELSVVTGFSGEVEELRNDDGVLTLLVAGKSITVDQVVAARAASTKI